MDKPYLLRPWEIERLTDRQIIELYYRARNDKGVPATIPDEQHEWTQRKKQVSTQDLLLNKFDNFMKMGDFMFNYVSNPATSVLLDKYNFYNKYIIIKNS